MTNSDKHLYILDTTQLDNIKVFNYWYSRMPEYRRKKIDSFRFLKDKKLSLGAGILLHQGFNRAGITSPKIVYNDNKKPFLDGEPNIHFNLSHSGQIAVCAFSDSQVGVDAEITQHFENDLLKHIYSKDEIDFVNSHSSDNDNLYTLLWTVKESVMKYLGTGLSLSPDKIKVDLNNPIKVVCDEYSVDNLFFSDYSIKGYSIIVCSDYKHFTNELEWVQI